MRHARPALLAAVALLVPLAVAAPPASAAPTAEGQFLAGTGVGFDAGECSTTVPDDQVVRSFTDDANRRATAESTGRVESLSDPEDVTRVGITTETSVSSDVGQGSLKSLEVAADGRARFVVEAGAGSVCDVEAVTESAMESGFVLKRARKVTITWRAPGAAIDFLFQIGAEDEHVVAVDRGQGSTGRITKRFPKGTYGWFLEWSVRLPAKGAAAGDPLVRTSALDIGVTVAR